MATSPIRHKINLLLNNVDCRSAMDMVIYGQSGTEARANSRDWVTGRELSGEGGGGKS